MDSRKLSAGNGWLWRKPIIYVRWVKSRKQDNRHSHFSPCYHSTVLATQGCMPIFGKASTSTNLPLWSDDSREPSTVTTLTMRKTNHHKDRIWCQTKISRQHTFTIHALPSYFSVGCSRIHTTFLQRFNFDWFVGFNPGTEGNKELGRIVCKENQKPSLRTLGN